MASTISPSVILSQRQMIRPKLGFFLTRASCSSRERELKRTTPARRGLKLCFSSSCKPASSKSPGTSAAIAGAAVSPGDSIPARWRRPGTFGDNSTMKSPLSLAALTPANWAIIFRASRLGTSLFAPSKTRLNPSWLVPKSSFSSTLSPVGPIIKLPAAVGITRIPLLILPGTGKIVDFTTSFTDRSKMYSSPLRGRMEK